MIANLSFLFVCLSVYSWLEGRGAKKMAANSLYQVYSYAYHDGKLYQFPFKYATRDRLSKEGFRGGAVMVKRNYREKGYEEGYVAYPRKRREKNG